MLQLPFRRQAQGPGGGHAEIVEEGDVLLLVHASLHDSRRRCEKGLGLAATFSGFNARPSPPDK